MQYNETTTLWHFLCDSSRMLPRPRSLWLLFTLVTLLLCACGKPSTENTVAHSESSTVSGKWNHFPVTLTVDAYILSNTNAANDVNDALAFWENKAGKHLFHLAGAWNNGAPYLGDAANPEELLENVIYLQGAWPFPNTISGKTIVFSDAGTIAKAVVLLNADQPLCSGDCVGETNKVSRRRLIAHELGHFLGLNHSSDVDNIMYPSVLPGGSLDAMQVDMTQLNAVVN